MKLPINTGKVTRNGLCVLSLIATLVACQTTKTESSGTASENSFIQAYADIALSAYSQSLVDAKQLQKALQTMSNRPNTDNLALAKIAWLKSRESYGVTEIFRLSNGPIDAEEGWQAEAYGALEGQINAWPLDENMIDYTIDESGQKTSGNIIDTTGIFMPGGEDVTAIDVDSITPEAISALNENGGDANVASGYHAIEFLLWGQDQDYANFIDDGITKGPLTAGQRPVEDFTTAANAKRRLQYLQAASQKLVDDLTLVRSAWLIETSTDCSTNANGCYRAALLGELQGDDGGKNIQQAVALRQIISGMGVFIKSELANERIAVALLTPSEEDEHSCFSDNTHRDITLNYRGFVNVLKSTLNGNSFGESLYGRSSAGTQKKIDRLITSIDGRIANMNRLAESKWHFDYQIIPGNNDREIRKMKNEMRKLGDSMVAVAKDIGLSLTSEDVTDGEETRI